MLVDGLPVHFSYEGDMSEISKWIPYAKRIFCGMRHNGKVTDNKRVTDTVEIHVSRLPSYNKIHIKAGSCPPFTSGLADILLPPKPTIDGIDPTWDLVDSNGKPYKAIRQFFPHVRKDNSNTYGPYGESVLLAKNYTEDEPSKLNSLVWKTPGKYTGAMRKVVQVIIGQGKPVPYEYKFYKCHGIFKTTDGTPWVIEIGQTSGVVAWKLPVCSKADKADEANSLVKDVFDDLGYYPLPDKGPMDRTDPANKANSVISLLGPSGLSEFYSKSSFFDTCGWAFNPMGNAAQNTCWDMQSGYKVGYRYRLDIIENENKPVSASLSIVESGVLHGNRVGGLKVPIEGGLIPMKDFDLFYGKFPQHPSPTGPMYVFFKETGEEVVARMTPGQPTQAINNLIATNFLDPQVLSLGNFQTTSGFQSMEPNPYVDGGFTNRISTSGSLQSTSFHYDFYTGLFSGVTAPIPGRNYLKDSGVTGTGSAYVVTGGTDTTRLALVIPWYDREAIYSVYTRDIGGSGSITQRYSYGQYAFVYGTIVMAVTYGPGSLCATGSGWTTWSGDAPLIGSTNPAWFLAGFSKLLPSIPVCDDTIPYWQNTFTIGITSQLFSDETFTEGAVRLITSKNIYDVSDTASSTFFSYWEENSHFMAVYSDAFTQENNLNIYAYKQPDDDIDIFTTATLYPNVTGKQTPILFVGKP